MTPWDEADRHAPDAEGYGWLVYLGVPTILAVAAGVAYLWWASRYEAAVAKELGELVLGVLGEQEGALWRRLHASIRGSCEKPLVYAFERSIRSQLGRPEVLHTSTLVFEDAPPGFLRVSVEVKFVKQSALVGICWEPADGNTPAAIGSLTVDPEDSALDIISHANSSAFEQKSDVFFAHFFAQRHEATRGMMHDNLKAKMSAELLSKQQQNLARHMGITTLYEPDAAYDTAAVENLGGMRLMVISAVLQGDAQNAVAVLHWAVSGMRSELIKFEIKTTGKPNKETVFVNPDGSRITEME